LFFAPQGALEAGVNGSALARSHDINPQQLFGWRRRFRTEAEALIASSRRDPEPVSFAPVHVDAPVQGLPASLPAARTCDGSIEITIGAAKVRIRGAADTKTLAFVLKALKVLA
jgi:transposase